MRVKTILNTSTEGRDSSRSLMSGQVSRIRLDNLLVGSSNDLTVETAKKEAEGIQSRNRL